MLIEFPLQKMYVSKINKPAQAQISLQYMSSCNKWISKREHLLETFLLCCLKSVRNTALKATNKPLHGQAARLTGNLLSAVRT